MADPQLVWVQSHGIITARPIRTRSAYAVRATGCKRVRVALRLLSSIIEDTFRAGMPTNVSMPPVSSKRCSSWRIFAASVPMVN